MSDPISYIKNSSGSVDAYVDDPINSIIKESIRYNLGQLHDGYVNYANGSFANNPAPDNRFMRTTHIPVIGSKIVFLNTVRDYCGVAFYDVNKSYISGYGDDSKRGEFISLEVPTGAAYFAASYHVSEDKGMEFYIAGIDTVLSGSNDLIAYSVPAPYTGKYVSYKSGLVWDHANFNCTDFIKLHAGSRRLLVKNSFVDDAGLAFYDESYSFISGIGSDSPVGPSIGGYYLIVEIPSGASYFRVSEMSSQFGRGATPAYVFDLGALSIDTHDDHSDVTEEYEKMIVKLLCIGDSLTYGSDYTSGESEGGLKEDYPYYFAKLSGADVVNEGHPGWSASGMWNDLISAEYDFTPYDCFIVWLGTNNGLTDSLSTDVDPFTDYNDFAQTETGYYCKILSKIIEQVPNARIFLGTVYASKGDVNTTNTTIRHIASNSKYSSNVVGVVDNNDGTLYGGDNQDVLHPGGNAVHFGRYGNFVLASHWIDGVRKAIGASPDTMNINVLGHK